MGFLFQWIRIANHNIEFDRLPSLVALEEDFWIPGGWYKAAFLVEAEIVAMAALKVAFQSVSVGLILSESNSR